MDLQQLFSDLTVAAIDKYIAESQEENLDLDFKIVNRGATGIAESNLTETNLRADDRMRTRPASWCSLDPTSRFKSR